jgi:hypothetical protein
MVTKELAQENRMNLVLRHGMCRREVSTQMRFLEFSFTHTESCFCFGRPEIRSTHSRGTRISSLRVRQLGIAVYVSDVAPAIHFHG